jgi:hypothetical protein
MAITHSLNDLKHYLNEASQFFASELFLLKETIPKITDDRMAKAATLLISCGQTGAALLQLANQTDAFTREAAMLARAFMETITNFCYVCVCDEKEYRKFVLHPVYKQYHNTTLPKMEDDLDSMMKNASERLEKQEQLKKISIVQEALSVFSETNPRLNWTRKKLHERIAVIEKWGKVMDVFFTINQIQYYSDASEALHGSLYGCTYNIGLMGLDFDPSIGDELDKNLYRDTTCMLLHLGILIHESLTLISYSNDIEENYKSSYRNRTTALNFLFHVLEKTICCGVSRAKNCSGNLF